MLAARRAVMVLLTTTILIFFSEKTFWYPQGYALFTLLLFYSVPVYAVLWAIARLRVHRLSGLVLVAALYGFLVEGVLTPVLYEGGPLDPIMPAYFIGWHGLLGFLFGWYLLRKWLLHGRTRRLAAASLLFGLFWGLWSLTYWLPGAAVDFDVPTRWPAWQFGLHAFTFTLLLMLAHGLLGRGGWLPAFRPGRLERWLVGGLLLFFYASLALPAGWWTILKLALLLALVLLPLRRAADPAAPDLFARLHGPVPARRLLPLLWMPVGGTAVYTLATLAPPAVETLELINEFIPLFQAVGGGAAFLWALAAAIRGGPGGQPETAATKAGT